MGHHDTRAWNALEETKQFSMAIERAREMLSEKDTLIVVSSDHSHTMSYAGYPDRHSNILFTAGVDETPEKIPYFTLSYANGPGNMDHMTEDGKRVDPRTMDVFNNTFRYPTTNPKSDETHGGDDVAVYASGPFSHLFTATYEQNVIPHLMAYAACIGDGLKMCDP